MKNSDFKDPKEKMVETFQTIWAHVKPAERDDIKNIWSTIMEPAEVLSWEPTSNDHEYRLEIREPIVGSHPDIPMGELIIEKEMNILFSEDKISGTEHYRQMIQFPGNGILIRIGMGWLSKDSPIESIFFEENQQGQMWCTVQIFGQNVARSAEDALAFWKKIEWQV